VGLWLGSQCKLVVPRLHSPFCATPFTRLHVRCNRLSRTTISPRLLGGLFGGVGNVRQASINPMTQQREVDTVQIPHGATVNSVDDGALARSLLFSGSFFQKRVEASP
jgi:hypothetical protein